MCRLNRFMAGHFKQVCQCQGRIERALACHHANNFCNPVRRLKEATVFIQCALQQTQRLIDIRLVRVVTQEPLQRDT